jgi:hypothetical protein
MDMKECPGCAGLILAASGQMDSYISGSPSRNPPPPTVAQADSVSSQAVSVSERLEKLSVSNTGARWSSESFNLKNCYESLKKFASGVLC